MKKTFREKFIFGCTEIIKKHKLLKIPMLCCMTVFLSIYYTCIHFSKNEKRYASLCVFALFFLVNSSFNFHDAALSRMETSFGTETTGYTVELTAEEEGVAKDHVDLIDDAEVLEGYDDVALLDVENLDTFTLDDILEDNDSYADRDRVSESKEEDAQGYEFDRTDWRLILINKQHPIPEEYEFPLGTIKGSLQCDERIIEELLAMMQAAKEDGVDLVICSPYRDYNRQTVLFNRKISNYMNAGMSYMDAYKYSSMAVTSPNASEHQVGLAIDFYSNSYKVLNEGFADTEAGKWLAENSGEYGFILRYPKGKEYITGIGYEPWHFRYVGREAAEYITQNSMTLEEFWEDL